MKITEVTEEDVEQAQEIIDLMETLPNWDGLYATAIMMKIQDSFAEQNGDETHTQKFARALFEGVNKKESK